MVKDSKSRFTGSRRFGAGLRVLLAISTLTSSPLNAAKGLKPLEIKQRYSQVLSVLAAGDLERAVADLQQLELAVVGDERSWRFVETLWRAKLQVIRDLLTEPNVDLLMPVIVLHHEAYFRYSETDRRYLAQHSRRMSAELAEVYAERSGTPAAGAFAAWILTSFASYVWSPSNIGLSAELFYRAHLLDPGNRLALAGVAAAWERSGTYDKAIETLTKARRQDPENPELLLRLSMCELRYVRGSTATALSGLETLTGEEMPAWIRSVAYQELARARLASDGPNSAETTLREALTQLPGDQQLSLQLAAVLDGQRRRSEAMAVLESIEILGWDRESPRQTYDFWEPPDLSTIRSDLRQAMEAGLDELAAAMRSVAARGAGS